MTDAPRANREADEVARRRALRRAPHMAPLAAYVDELRAAHGADRVPDFDPVEAGVRARLLLLLEAPGPRAAPARGGSGFVSADNDSPTSETLWRLHREAGTDRADEVATWNTVPWYLGDAYRIRAATTADVAAARPWTEALLGLLPELRVVLLVGRAAARGWERLGVDAVPAVACPHPSPANLAARPWCRDEVLAGLCAALSVARASAPSGGSGSR